MAATIRDVAAAAGVSPATVSFVLNGTKAVAPHTRKRIEDAVAELGYRRNAVARALASQRTRTIALISPFRARQPDYSIREFIIGAREAAAEADHHLVIWPEDGVDALADLVGHGLADGVILMAVCLDDPRVTALQDLGTPFALIGRTRDPSGLAYVDIDFEESMRQALDHLVGLGHRRIAFINGDQTLPHLQGHGPFVRSERAYREQMNARGLESTVLVAGSEPQDGRLAAGQLLAIAPDATAVVVCEDTAAAGMMSELNHRGVNVPRDLSVMSFISSTEMAALSNPPLTTITAPGAELGVLGTQALLHELIGTPMPTQPLRTGELVLGESTGPVDSSLQRRGSPLSRTRLSSQRPTKGRRHGNPTHRR